MNFPIKDEKLKITDIIPAIGLSIMFFIMIHGLHSSNYEELVRLRDQSWKTIVIDITAPYHYEISKVKLDYSLNLYDGNNEIYSTGCGYKINKICKAEYPISQKIIQKIEFYKSSNQGKGHVSGSLRIKSIQYLDQNQQLQSILLKQNYPNTKQAITKQKWKLGFSTFIAVWFFMFLAYLNSIATIVPRFVTQLVYIFLAGNIVFIALKTFMILI